MAGKIESYLLVTNETRRGMIERSFAALSSEDLVLVPKTRERRTLLLQLLDQAAHRGIILMRAGGRAKLRRNAPSTFLSLTDERARSRVEKDEAEKIAFPRLVQPSDEKPSGLCVPTSGRPASIKQISRSPDCLDAIQRRRRKQIRIALPRVGIALSGHLEQIGAFRPTELQGPR
jgi:hypothetical protein